MKAKPRHDDFLINLDEDWQCRWWSRELGVPADTLRSAIRQVGPLARNVRLHLKRTEKPAAP
jgi:hypothetical protein